MAKVNKLFSAPVDGTKVELAADGVTIGGYHIVNLTATLNYIQVFNLPAASVTIGATVPYFSIPLPAEGGATLWLNGLQMTNGLTIACTTDYNNSTSSNAFVLMTLTL
jgi:hypothetical protein